MKQLFHYTACGLPNVWLENGYAKKETKYGTAISVKDVDGLHKLLATKLIEKNSLLAGYEFRFLRVQLGRSSQNKSNRGRPKKGVSARYCPSCFSVTMAIPGDEF